MKKTKTHFLNHQRFDVLKYVILCYFSIFLSIFVFGASVGTAPTLTGENETLFEHTVSGTVIDQDGLPVIGATVLEKNTTNGTITDVEGKYSLEVSSANAILTFSFVGYTTQEINVANKDVLDVTLSLNQDELEEVVVVGFGEQTKESLVTSVTTVKAKDLKVPTSNLTTSLAGNVPGMIAFQRNGEPGINLDGTNKDNASFFIRGVTTLGVDSNSPLILIDGVELTVQDLARINPDDIAEFSIMKDATATAIYGARGANGVVFVTLKEGEEGPTRLSARAEVSSSMPTRELQIADPITYMRMKNEAEFTRQENPVLPYTDDKIEQTMIGDDPYTYPVVDWGDILMKDFTINKRFNANLSGGGKVSRYYISLSASNDKGLLNVPKISNYNSNIDFNKFQLRSNANLNLTGTTKLKLNFTANYDDYNGPLRSGSDVYEDILHTSPVDFLPFYEKDVDPEFQYTRHILFGNVDPETSGTGFQKNPYADMSRGYTDRSSAKILGQLELDQDLAFLTEGLTNKIVVNINRESGNGFDRFNNPYYYAPIVSYEGGERNVRLKETRIGNQSLGYTEKDKRVVSSTYLENRITYRKDINEDLNASALVVLTLNNRIASNAGSLDASLPFRNMGVSGRYTLGHKKRYFGEFTFGYNGSERFGSKNRWGFFPSGSLGWIVSKEPFFENLNDVIDNLKFKASYGVTGSDQIGGASDRFFYLSRVNLNDGSRAFVTGEDFNFVGFGTKILNYANPNIGWEEAVKSNVGVELGLFNEFSLEAEYFTEKRTNILQDRIIPSSVGLDINFDKDGNPIRPKSNVGATKSHGIDGRVTYNKSFANGMWLQTRGTFTYATNEITEFEEPDYSDTPWLSRIGRPIHQWYGYVAERLFVDDEEVLNSPLQFDGNYSGGDLKYRDIDGDGRITQADKVPIGNSIIPEINYGFGNSMGYKGFDFSFFFQGSANSSFFLDPWAVAPFVENRVVLQEWADSHWSEANKDIYAKWPRLSRGRIQNNIQISNWYLQDGRFLRLKSAELGFTLPKTLQEKFKMGSARFYISGTNLYNFTKFKLWDIEMARDGFRYPPQRVFNAGFQFSL